MSPHVPRPVQEVTYWRWAQEYLHSLPPEHFMEAVGQARQREITVESLDLVSARRPDFHVFNELLVQYPLRGQRRPGQVVPDNMVVLTDLRIRATISYDVPLEPARPFWVLDYVSPRNKRKDYEDNYRKFERELKVPYYLVFCPDDQELRLYRHNRRKYTLVRRNSHGRYPIRELELEIGLLEGWGRYWYRGELLFLPGEMLRQLNEFERQAEAARREAEAVMARLRPEEEKRRADELQRRLEAVERESARRRDRPGGR